jgi:hypothetical protein
MKIQVSRNLNVLSGEKELNIGCEILVHIIHVLGSSPQTTHPNYLGT